MEVGESSASRRRTESSGGSSDSELSEGWNYIDELDVIQDPSSRPVSREQTENSDRISDLELSEGWNYVGLADVAHRSPPSSDGESVEIIEPEDEPPQNVKDLELHQEVAHAEEALEMINEAESLLPLNNREPSVTEHGANLLLACSDSKPQRMVSSESMREYPDMQQNAFVLPHEAREEMFDPSFCWVLIISAFVVVFSNLAYMAAESVFGWERDKPTSEFYPGDWPTANSPQKDDFTSVYPWDVDVIVDIVDDTASDMDYDAEIVEISETFKETDDHKSSKQPSKRNGDSKQNANIKNHEILRYFKILTDVPHSAETQTKFAQTMLILEALYKKLKDLEELVIKNSELNQLLKRQQSKFHNAIDEVELSVERSMSKLAFNVLNKVLKLERKFENQWCNMEKNGHKESLKNLFYNCEEDDEVDESKVVEKHQKTDDNLHFVEKRNIKRHMSIDNFQYEVDKDSTGKEFSKPSTDGKESEEYYKLVKSGLDFNRKYLKKTNNEISSNTMENSKVEPEDWSDGVKKSSKKNIPRMAENLTKQAMENSVPKIVINYLKSRCQENLKTKKTNDYREIKNHIAEIIMVPENVFDGLYKEYCINPVASELESQLEIAKYLRKHCRKNQKTGKPNEYRVIKDSFQSEGLIPNKLFDTMFIKYCTQNHGKSTINRSAEEIVKNYLKDSCKKNLKNKKDNNYEELKAEIRKKVKISKEMFDVLYKQNCRPAMDKSTLEIVSKYLRRKCQTNVKPHQMGTQSNDYHKLKDYINHKVNIPKESFDELYAQYCKQNDDSQTSDKAKVEAVSKYLKEQCQTNINRPKMAKHSIDYHKIKEYIDRKVPIPKESFDPLFERYCKPNDSSFKSDSSFKKGNWKGDYSRKNKKSFKKTGTLVIEDHNKNDVKHIEIKILDSSKVRDNVVNLSDSDKDKVIKPDNKRRQWTFSFKESSSDNKTNVNGDWFIKAGESRSRIRWLHNRGDWWFERASYRRNHPRSSELYGRFKNWYFGRVWARLYCRQNPYASSCNFPQDETITIPNSNSNVR